MNHNIRTITAVSTIAAAAVLASGCGPAGSTAAGSGGGTTGSSASPSASRSIPAPRVPVPVSSSPGSSGSGGAGGTAASGPACVTKNLKASLGSSQGAAGSAYVVIDFTNTGAAPCTMYGYPGVSLTGAGGQVGAAAERDRTHSLATVTLAPGAKANATVRVTNAQDYPSSKCSPHPASSLTIYPPSQTQALSVAYQSTGCQAASVKLLTITPVASGPGGA